METAFTVVPLLTANLAVYFVLDDVGVVPLVV